MSPTVLRERGYRFFFFSREEPRRHIHVEGGSGEAKFWLDPSIELARNHGLTPPQIREAQDLLEVNYERIVQAWRERFGS